jgi:hypothetical protein
LTWLAAQRATTLTIRGPRKKNFSHGDRKDHEDFQKAGNG